VCRSISHNFNRDFYNLAHCPYTVRFLVPSGLGTDISVTTVLNQTGIVVAETIKSVSFLGSSEPKPTHKITLVDRDNADVLLVENNDTDDCMEINLDNFSNGDYLEIDEENQTVKKNGTVDINYSGKFPTVALGSNSLKLTVYGDGSHEDLNEFLSGESQSKLYENTGTSKKPEEAQSFIPTVSGRIGKIRPRISKVTAGSLAGAMVWWIRDDDNGKPGELVATDNDSFAILVADVNVSSIFADILPNSHVYAPFLVRGRKYWLTLDEDFISVSDASNYFSWQYGSTVYARGKSMARGTTSENWVDGIADADLAAGVDPGVKNKNFQIMRGDGNVPGWDITWKITYTKKYL